MAGSRSAAQMQILQEFNPENIQREWKEKFTQGKLRDALRSHWCQFVPAVFHITSDQVNEDAGREERKARRLLFRPLETFLCDGDPDTTFRQLKEKDKPPQLCGRVFKMGEPTYSCRDCGMDPTCVLCIECFQHSTHQKHRYKMSTSGGGGYCDCGDVEAWKEDPYCDIHKRGLDIQDKPDPVELLPPEMCQRGQELFTYVVQYAIEILTWQHCDGLPVGLQPQHMDNTYCTMLFNDEVHTYEQVIHTLTRAIDCSQKEAVDFATTVDREGRSCVRCGPFAVCEKARDIMERNTSRHGGKPLKVLVMHTSVVAHQVFAQKALSWLQQVMSHAAGLRQLFCKLSMEPQTGDDMSLVERVMLADTHLWKGARIISHQLFMAGVLMDTECKKQFAILFTKIYPLLMQEFIQDDHDHSVCAVSESVQIFTVPTLHYESLMRDFIVDDHYRAVSMTSVSVQLFTVPTLARTLITEHNLLQVILCTFLKECQSKKNGEGKFAFERNERNQTFRRAQYMLYDLKYALTCKPEPQEWNSALRRNFINGFTAMLDLLRCMQGMDSVTRQTGQHIEFEPEWEGAFNLQLKLEDNIAVIQHWCSTDKQVLVDAIVASIDMLYECRDRLDAYKMESCSVGNHKCDCIKYDVSSQPISIHLPVSRLLAGLYPLCNKFDIDLKQLHSRQKLHPVALIEPSLRCQVMIAQTQASMWRRNGYSLLNQIYFYHNVRCRTEMYDKDIVMLQAGAALLDPNDFLIHVLNKFGLLNWAKMEYDTLKLNPAEDLIRQIVTLAEECLTILITIIGERYVPGVGEVTHKDTVRREIIHLLCISPMAHSELAKALPEDPHHETGVEDVVHDVAVFRKPTASGGKGMYELKPECYGQYNPYFYHYSRADQSKSEESQRKRKKAANEDQALLPPVPPPFTSVFSPVIHLLDCDVMIHIIRLVLRRTRASRSRSWSEMQLEKILHLIGLALHEERRTNENGDNYFKFVEKSTSGEMNVLESLEALVGHPNVAHEAQKDLLSWVIKNFREVCRLRNTSFAVDMSSSTLPSSESDEKVEAEKQRKAELAAKRRARIMAQMSKMQRDFIKENAELFECTRTDLQSAGSDMDISQGGEPESGKHLPVALGLQRSPPCLTGTFRETCILCQEEQDIMPQDRAMVLAAFIQRSTVLSRERGKVIEPLIMPATLNVGPHTSTCGHVMHSDCWQRFFDNIVAKERRRPFRFRHTYSYDIEKNEFLCPLCETLSNTVIPIIPYLPTLIKDSDIKYVDLSINDWLDGIQKTVKSSIQQSKDKETEDDLFLFVPCPLSTVTKLMAESVAKNFQLLYEYVYLDASTHFSDTITDMLRKFSTDVYAMGLGVHPDDKNSRVPILAWSTCAYTIMATEQCLRDEGRPLVGSLPSRQADCLSALVRFAAVCNQVIQPEIIKKHCVNILSATILERSSNHLQETPCVLDIEMFHYLVQLVLSLPVLYAEDDGSSPTLSHIPIGGLNDEHAVQLVFTAHVVQIMLSADFPKQESMDVEDTDAEAMALLKIYTEIKRYAGIEASPLPSAWQLSQYVKDAALPFLRNAGLFFHYLTGIKLSEALQEVIPEEFEILCDYLALPRNISTLFNDEQGNIVMSLIKSWCEDSAVKEKLSASREKILQYPLSVNQLMELPDDYSTLINKVSTFTCPKSDGDESRAPTMCLVCGGMLCSQSYCCQTELDGMTVGAATAHAHSCGAGTGMFLRVRECQVLLLSGKTKGCFFAPPYLDNYGETDQGLRRGNPLHLCPDRYKKLQKLWLSHSIPEEIVHCLESNTTLLTIDWRHL